MYFVKLYKIHIMYLFASLCLLLQEFLQKQYLVFLGEQRPLHLEK